MDNDDTRTTIAPATEPVSATTRRRPKRTKADQPTELDRMLDLVGTDKVEVEALPDVTQMSSIEAAEAMSSYYARRAELIAKSDAGRRERTRGLIILGALAGELPSAARALFRDAISALKPADIACVRSIDWARAVIDKQTAAHTKSEP